MEKQEKCPWYVWIFSFLAMFALSVVIMIEFAKRDRKEKLTGRSWVKPWGQMMAAIFGNDLLLFVPYTVCVIVGFTLFPEVWAWLYFPTAYLLGIYPAIRLWRWRKKHLNKVL